MLLLVQSVWCLFCSRQWCDRAVPIDAMLIDPSHRVAFGHDGEHHAEEEIAHGATEGSGRLPCSVSPPLRHDLLHAAAA